MFVDCWFEVDVKNVMEGRGGEGTRLGFLCGFRY